MGKPHEPAQGRSRGSRLADSDRRDWSVAEDVCSDADP